MLAGRISLSLLALAFNLTLVASACAQVLESGYVLLTNDRCLTGRVELIADRYHVQKTPGNQVVIPRDQVQFVGSSLQELYRFKLNRLPIHSRPGDHFQLAQWCKSVHLLAEAGQHYLKVVQTNPPATSPAVKRLGVEIKEAMLQQPEFRSYLGMAPLSRTPTQTAQSSNNPSVRSAIQPASTFSNALLSNQVQSRFSEQIQHVLTNRCGAASCHGHAASNPLQLLDVTAKHAARDTDANLRAVLQYVGQGTGSDTQSPLLEYATGPHGGSSVPAIDPRETQLIEALVGWIQFVQNPVITAEATSSTHSPTLQPVPDGALPLRAVPGNPGNPDDTDDPFDPAEFHRLRSQRRTVTNLQPSGEPPSGQPALPPMQFDRQTIAN